MRNYKIHVLRAAWIPADNSEKRTKGQWHSWINEAFCFMKDYLNRNELTLRPILVKSRY